MIRYWIQSEDLIRDLKNADGVIDLVTPSDTPEYDEFQQTYENFCEINGYSYIEVSIHSSFGILLCIVDDDVFDYTEFLVVDEDNLNG